tara:strand:- start:150 stop:578 length:429 start_codon:yes stop_codon:yes gene_type:complete
MKITNIDSIPYAIPVKNFTDAYTDFTHSNAVLIKIHTDEGVTGIGEACAWEPEFYGETVESIHTTILNYVAPNIIGEDPRNINKIKGTIYLYFFTKDLNSITSGKLICIFRVGQCAADIGIQGKGSVDMQIAKVEVPLGIGC